MNNKSIEELTLEAIDLFKNNPDKVDISFLQRRLNIGTIKANKILEILENDNIITEYQENIGRKLI